ncbi:MAG TPA: hypothetical protein VFV99_19910 [Kofleriaceae bacterium]|nr:hypothetical protein [Kofleriaceae bacterium]
MIRRSALILGVCWLGQAPAPARADVYCGASNPNHDAPAGYLVLSRSQDIVAPVVSALGEYRTHTMLSHGSWFTHAAMRTPSSGRNAPHLNSDQLRWGDPGAEQISAASAYTFLYEPGNGGLEFISKQSGTSGGGSGSRAEELGISSYFWEDWPWRFVPARCEQRFMPSFSTYYDCTGTKRTAPYTYGGSSSVSVMTGGGYYRLRDDGGDIPYSLHQYVDIGSLVTRGDRRCHFTNYGYLVCTDEGVVCSTLMAWGVKKALGRQIAVPTYTPQQTLDAASALHHGVMSKCLNHVGIFESFASWLLGSGDEWQICDEMGWQVLNCMLDPNTCTLSYQINSTVRASTVSPDSISGWRPGQDWGNPAINGPWTQAGWYEDMSFSGGGTTYTCWAN